jgi:hypothetical protein
VSAAHYLRGYDKLSDGLEVQYEVPASLLSLVRQLIGDTPSDPELFDPHQLTPKQVKVLASKLGYFVDDGKYEFYFEAEEDWKKVAEMRDALQG